MIESAASRQRAGRCYIAGMDPTTPRTSDDDTVPAAVSATVADSAPPAAPPAKSRYDRSIVEGPLVPAVWKLAWPTMLQNVIGGLQGIVDHVMVGRYVGYTGNAAIGVSWQIFLVVVVFISSLFTGMSVLVARFAGAGDHEKVNRTVHQAFLTAFVLSLGVLAPIGYVLAPSLLTLVNATPEVTAEALPYLRIMFVFSWGLLIFFMLGGALRSAGDAQTPLKLGIVATAANLVLNVILIRGLGPIPAFGTTGAAMGTVIAMCGIGFYAIWALYRGRWVVAFPRDSRLRPDWSIIRALFRFGLPTGVQGIAMNVGGVFLLAYVGSLAQSAAAQAAYTVAYTQLFSLITWTAVGLMGAAAAMAGQNLGADKPERAAQAVEAAGGIAASGAAVVGVPFLLMPRQLLSIFGMAEPEVVELGVQLLRVLSLSGIFIAVALTFTGGLQGTGDTRSPLFISIVSQVVIPLGMCFILNRMGTLDAIDIWLAILIGHMTRCVLSVVRFRQGRWREIAVDIGG
ncbi:MAG: MATE family efflux transporter [Gemmatimonadetes bacterium]|nr:MATE family efflux transporter [Gemmatimonadota bacterium]